MPRKAVSAARRTHAPKAKQAFAGTALPAHLLETIPDAVIVVDSAGTIVQVNSQTEAMFGYGHKELIGQKVELLVPQRYRDGHHHHRASYASQPKIRRMGAGLDLYGTRKDGSEFPVEISLSPISTPDGSFVVSAIRDISDRKKIEEDLRRAHEELNRSANRQLGEQKNRMASIVESSDDAIIGKDLDGTITTWNRGAERIYRSEEHTSELQLHSFISYAVFCLKKKKNG